MAVRLAARAVAGRDAGAFAGFLANTENGRE